MYMVAVNEQNSLVVFLGMLWFQLKTTYFNFCHKVEEYNIVLGQDKTAAQNKIKLLETERATAATERAELRSEADRLQDMISGLEEERAASDANFARLTEKISLLTIEKEKVGRL